MKTKDFIDVEILACPPTCTPLPVVLTKGEGIWLWDIEGKKYLDMMAAYSAANFGHANPRLLKKLIYQAQKLAMPSRAFYNDQLGALVTRICTLSGLEMGIPMNTGAEAVETAIKVARRWSYEVKRVPENQAEIIVAENNFHGRTTTIISFSTELEYRRNFGPFTPGFKAIPFGDAEALEKAITPYTAAFLVEPIQGEAGIIVPPKGYLREVRRICTEKQVLFLLDEVQSGLGRTGKMFAFQHDNITPDGLMIGKALGGGILPISFFLGKREAVSLMTARSHGSTFGGNPLACAVALEVLTIFDEKHLDKHAAELGEYMLTRLSSINSFLIKEVRGCGLWAGVEFHKHLVSAREVCEKMAIKGVLSTDTHYTVVRFAPPLIITREEIDFGLNVFEEVLQEIEKNITK